MKKRSIFILLVIFGAVQTLDAQQRWDEIDYPPINSFEKPDLEIFTLDNGVQFYLVEDDELPLINLRVLVRTGGVLVPNEKAGLHSVTGTVMRTGGTTTISGDDLNELLENRAARMETSIGFTSGSATMNVLSEDFERLLPVFIDLLKNPAFPEEKIDLAKTQQKSGISRRNDEQSSVANREFRRLIYGTESVYGRNTEYETIDNITRDDLVEFHSKSFVGANMMVGVIGDFNTEEMKEKLEEAFRQIPAGEQLELEFPEIDYQYEPSINFVDKRDVNQSYILMGHIGGMRDNPDYASLQVMNRVLSGGFSGRLFRNVRSDMGLAYSVFGSYGSNNFYPGVFFTGVLTQSSTTAEAIEAVKHEVDRLLDEQVTEEELEITIDRFLNSLVFQYDSRASVLNERMSYDYAGLDPDTFDRLVEEIQDVTTEDIQAAAQKYLWPDALQILVVGNAEEIGDQLEQFGDVNEVDISIPEPADEEDEVAGDLELGSEWLGKMAGAVFTDGEVRKVDVEGSQTVHTAQGSMSIDFKTRMDFENMEFVNELQAPVGTIVMEVNRDGGTMKMGGQEQPMTSQQHEGTLKEYQRHYIHLALNHDTVDAEFMGETEKNMIPVAEIRVLLDTPVTLYLSLETALPVVSSTREMDPQRGERVTVETIYDQWEVVDGVAYAYQSSSLAGGEEQGSTQVSSHAAVTEE